LNPPGSADDYMNTAAQLPQLGINALAAINRHDVEAFQEPGVGLHRLGDLDR